jgi:hypothetical protein
VRKAAVAMDSKRGAAADPGSNLSKILGEVLRDTIAGGIIFSAAGPEFIPHGAVGGAVVGTISGSYNTVRESKGAIDRAVGSEFATDVANCAIEWSSAVPAPLAPDVVGRDQGRAAVSGGSAHQHQSSIPWDKVNVLMIEKYPFK